MAATVGYTTKTNDVGRQLEVLFPAGDAFVSHTRACDHVSAGDACVGGCPIQRDEAEKLYLVCRQCGESFDSMETAAGHKPGDCGSEQGWDLLPESEAM